MSLRNAVGSVSTNPSHNTATVTEEVTIEGGKSTSGEGKLGGTVMGKERVGVLEEGDQDKPMVNPIRSQQDILQ